MPSVEEASRVAQALENHGEFINHRLPPHDPDRHCAPGVTTTNVTPRGGGEALWPCRDNWKPERRSVPVYDRSCPIMRKSSDGFDRPA